MRPFIAVVLACVSTLTLNTTTFAQSDSAPQTSANSVSSKKQMRKMNWKAEKDVRKAMTSTKGLDSSDVRIVAHGSKITLSGTVPEDDQIQLAESAAQSVAGGKSVVNNLTVKLEGH